MGRRHFRLNMRQFGRKGITFGLALMACSKVDTVNPGDSGPGAEVTTCGSLDPGQAVQLAVARLERIGTVGLSALAGLENSRSAARLLSVGAGTIIEPFVAEGQSELHDSLVRLREEYLVTANIESTTEASVTYLLRAASVCLRSGDEAASPLAAPTNGVGGIDSTGGVVSAGGMVGTGGGGGAGVGGATEPLDPDCVKEQNEHPTRVRISRIDCDRGDNVAIELLRDSPSQRMVLGQLYTERAEVELDLGAFLRSITITTSSTVPRPDGSYVEQSTTKPLVSEATGVLRASLSLTGNSQANGKISVSEALDVIFADDSAARIRLARGTDVVTILADGSAKTVKVTSNLGAADWRAKFQDFSRTWFGLEVTASGAPQEPVDAHIAGLRGELSFEGFRDSVQLDKLDLGGGALTAIQGTRTLLSFDARSAQGGAIAATLAAKADNSVTLGLAVGLGVQIHYGLEPVMTALQNPANFLAKDTLTVAVSSSAVLTLLPETDRDNLALTDGQVGQLLRVDSGTMSIGSAWWPDDTVKVAPNQCMSLVSSSQSGHNDLLADFVVGNCTP